MRLPELTIGQAMVGVAAIAVWLAVVRWGAVVYVLGAAALMYIPAFLWSATGGKIRGDAGPPDPVEGRGDLFLWAWALGTMGVASLFYVAWMWIL
jgi:hypothetical protein